ncbi:MAG TPA: hypothetical protein VKD72_22685 [Gemmataceae bacterium]|nr:hypothetical protein [Gemmataceae bacterium]
MPLSLPLKTIQVVRKLAVSYGRVMDLIRHGRIPPPQKDVSGDYIWSPEDVERARVALATARRGRPKKEVASGK